MYISSINELLREYTNSPYSKPMQVAYIRLKPAGAVRTYKLQTATAAKPQHRTSWAADSAGRQSRSTDRLESAWDAVPVRATAFSTWRGKDKSACGFNPRIGLQIWGFHPCCASLMLALPGSANFWHPEVLAAFVALKYCCIQHYSFLVELCLCRGLQMLGPFSIP